MIGRLSGVVLELQPSWLLLDVHGVGYELEIPLSTLEQLPAVGQSTTVHTHLVVREDAHLLYGFASHQERTLFRALIKISGVGPKLALSLLSGMEPDQLLRCLQQGEVTALTRIPGVGKKTAERLIVEMRDRVSTLMTTSTSTSTSTSNSWLPAINAAQEAEQALISLGYKPADALRALDGIDATGLDTASLLRAALRSMVRG